MILMGGASGLGSMEQTVGMTALVLAPPARTTQLCVGDHLATHLLATADTIVSCKQLANLTWTPRDFVRQMGQGWHTPHMGRQTSMLCKSMCPWQLASEDQTAHTTTIFWLTGLMLSQRTYGWCQMVTLMSTTLTYGIKVNQYILYLNWPANRGFIQLPQQSHWYEPVLEGKWYNWRPRWRHWRELPSAEGFWTRGCWMQWRQGYDKGSVWADPVSWYMQRNRHYVDYDALYQLHLHMEAKWTKIVY